MNAPIRFEDSDLIFYLYVQPNARHNKVVGLYNGLLKIQIMAPAVENKANEYLIKWLADEFSLSKNSILLLKGEHARQKTVRVLSPRIFPNWLSDYMSL